MIRLSNFPASERLIIGLAFILMIVIPAGLAHGQGGGVFTSGGDGSLPSMFVLNNTSGSGSCAMVHGGLNVLIGNEHSGDGQSVSARKATSAGDSSRQTKLDTEINSSLQLQSITEDKRSHCHTLMARVQMLPNGFPAVVAGNRFLIPAHPLSGAAKDGVACPRCHQL